MPPRTADLRGALVSDLPRGRLETRDHRRLIALPTDWLEALLARTPAAATAALGESLGAAFVADARAVLGDEQDPPPEDVAYALSAAFAARGLGVVHFERWGDALALVWHNPPGVGEAWDDVAVVALATIVSRLTGLDGVAAAPIGRGGHGELRVLFGSQRTCDLARVRARAGDGLAQIVALLERETAGAA